MVGVVLLLMATSFSPCAELRCWGVDSGVDFRALLPDHTRCISPSDFGFHNALVQPDGKLFFIDFEYAGWDDPAKTLCDFYCQPELPVPRSTWNQFADAMAGLAADAILERQRQEELFPLYQVKWCCILLNEFTVDAARRREFAAPQTVDFSALTNFATGDGADEVIVADFNDDGVPLRERPIFFFLSINSKGSLSFFRLAKPS